MSSDEQTELTGKQLAWCEAYLETFNKTEAARRAGYEGNDVTLASVGYENFRKPQIQEYIRQRLEEKAMSADEVLTRLADVGRGDISDFVIFNGRSRKPTLDLKSARDKGFLHLVKKISYDRKGRLQIELYDRVEALELLGKHHGLLTDKLEIKLSQEIDTILDTIEGVLDADSYQRVLQALSSRNGDGETGESKTPAANE